MSSKKKLVESALKHPELYAPAEVAYFRMWLQKRKEKKAAKKRLERLNLERTFLMS
jgi:hypothetical protein